MADDAIDHINHLPAPNADPTTNTATAAISRPPQSPPEDLISQFCARQRSITNDAGLALYANLRTFEEALAHGAHHVDPCDVRRLLPADLISNLLRVLPTHTDDNLRPFRVSGRNWGTAKKIAKIWRISPVHLLLAIANDLTNHRQPFFHALRQLVLTNLNWASSLELLCLCASEHRHAEYLQRKVGTNINSTGFALRDVEEALRRTSAQSADERSEKRPPVKVEMEDSGFVESDASLDAGHEAGFEIDNDAGFGDANEPSLGAHNDPGLDTNNEDGPSSMQRTSHRTTIPRPSTRKDGADIDATDERDGTSAAQPGSQDLPVDMDSDGDRPQKAIVRAVHLDATQSVLRHQTRSLSGSHSPEASPAARPAQPCPRPRPLTLVHEPSSEWQGIETSSDLPLDRSRTSNSPDSQPESVYYSTTDGDGPLGATDTPTPDGSEKQTSGCKESSRKRPAPESESTVEPKRQHIQKTVSGPDEVTLSGQSVDGCLRHPVVDGRLLHRALSYVCSPAGACVVDYETTDHAKLHAYKPKAELLVDVKAEKIIVLPLLLGPSKWALTIIERVSGRRPTIRLFDPSNSKTTHCDATNQTSHFIQHYLPGIPPVARAPVPHECPAVSGGTNQAVMVFLLALHTVARCPLATRVPLRLWARIMAVTDDIKIDD